MRSPFAVPRTGQLGQLWQAWGQVTAPGLQQVGPTTWVACSPDVVKELLQGSGPWRRKEVGVLGRLFEEGLLGTWGEEWRRQRSATQPFFLRRQIRAWQPIVRQVVNDHLDRWEEQVKATPRINLLQALYRLFLEVSTRLFCGLPPTEAEEVGLIDGLRQVLRTIPVSSHRTMEVGQGDQAWKMSLETIIPATLTLLERAGQGPPVLRALVGEAPDDPVRAARRFSTFLIAGFETTALSLGWTAWILARHPEHQGAAVASLAEPDGGTAHLSRVVSEAMRLFPPVWLMHRVTTAEVRIGGVSVPADHLIHISPLWMHRRAELWEEPEEFRPERFLPEAARERHPYAYFPFGGGQHLCIGRALALWEIPVVLRAMLERFELQPEPHIPVVPFATPISLRPRYGLPLHLLTRQL